MTTVAVVVAAGAGARMGAGTPKALLPVAGRPMLVWSIEAIAASERVDAIVVVAPPGYEQPTEMALAGAAEVLATASGGASRARSVAAGLARVPEDAGRVLVHDAARPLLTPEQVVAVLDALGDADGAILAAPVADTLKLAADDLTIRRTVDRGGLWRAETPQAFAADVLRRAVRAAEERGDLDAATDCAALVEAAGGRVRIVPSAAPNLKITTPADLELAERLLRERPRPAGEY